jgi:AcrR family transcriptional regulator
MSPETPSKRKYELRRRAEQVADTRLRITEAAIDLHGSVGPARTTLSAVAERAGVERRTLYRHFPSEADLFAACSAHWFAANPWPDVAAWRAIRDPGERLARALDELYAYYERTAPMYGNVLRDAELVQFARDAVAPLDAYLEGAVAVLAAGRGARGRRRTRLAAALRHALAFSTWRSLTGSGLDRADATALATALVDAA